MATTQIQRIGENDIFGRGLLKEQFCKTLVICNEIEIKTYFLFSPYFHLAPTRSFHISFVQYLALMGSKFIISLSQSANPINGYGFSTLL